MPTRVVALLVGNFCFFFFNDTATTEIYTLSLHDALPICSDSDRGPIRNLGRAIPRTLQPPRLARAVSSRRPPLRRESACRFWRYTVRRAFNPEAHPSSRAICGIQRQRFCLARPGELCELQIARLDGCASGLKALR